MSEEFDNKEFDNFFQERFQNFESEAPLTWQEMQTNLPTQKPLRRWLISLFTWNLMLLGIVGDSFLGVQEITPNQINKPPSQVLQPNALNTESTLPSTSNETFTQAQKNLKSTQDFRSRPQKNLKPTPDFRPSSSAPQNTVQNRSQALSPNQIQSSNQTHPQKKYAPEVIHSSAREESLDQPKTYLNTNAVSSNDSLQWASLTQEDFKNIPLTRPKIPRHWELPAIPKQHFRKALYFHTSFETGFFFYRLKPNTTDDKLINAIPSAQYKPLENLAYRLNFQFEKTLTKNLSANLGFSLAKQDGNLIYTYVQRAADSLAIQLVDDDELLVNPIKANIQEEIRFRNQSWSVESSLRYHLGGKLKAHSLRLGFLYERIRQKQFLLQEQSRQQEQKNFALLLAYQFRYPLSPRWQVYAEPNVRYYFQSIYQSPAVEHLKPHQWGLRLGFVYRIK